MLAVGMPTEEFFERVKQVAVAYVEVPPMAAYEIRWSSQMPEHSEEQQVLDRVVTEFGPMLIAALTD